MPDKQGSGGILSIEPFHEPGDLDELWDSDALLDRLVPLRAEILDGDLRPLYLAHLVIACDGLHTHVDRAMLQELLNEEGRSARQLTQYLVDLVNQLGGSDNCTVLAVCCY